MYAIWGIVDDTFLKLLVLRVSRYPKMAKIKASEGLKSWYCQFLAEYFIGNPKTAYNVSIPGYLTLTCDLMCCRWPISQIVGPKGLKILQIGQN